MPLSSTPFSIFSADTAGGISTLPVMVEVRDLDRSVADAFLRPYRQGYGGDLIGQTNYDVLSQVSDLDRVPFSVYQRFKWFVKSQRHRLPAGLAVAVSLRGWM